MISDHFVFPHFDHCPLGVLNTGIFYKTDSLHKFNKYEQEEIPRKKKSTGMTLDDIGYPEHLLGRQSSEETEVPPRVVMSFQLFIDEKLLASNSVEPISMCPGLFNQEIRNLSRSCFIWPLVT